MRIILLLNRLFFIDLAQREIGLNFFLKLGYFLFLSGDEYFSLTAFPVLAHKFVRDQDIEGVQGH